MSRSTRTSLVWWISAVGIGLIAAGCTHRAPSLRMLDTRAGYGAEYDDEEVALYERAKRNQESLLKRSAPRVAQVYIYPHELPTRDYFWGGYVSLVIKQDEWIFENPEKDGADPSGPAPAAVRAIKKPGKKHARRKRSMANAEAYPAITKEGSQQ